jgi:hypothetical protein
MLLRGVARTAVRAGTATAVSNRVSRRQAKRWSDQGEPIGSYVSEPQQPAQQGGGGDDTLGKLKELGELRDSGVLTEEEFAAQKAKLLG